MMAAIRGRMGPPFMNTTDLLDSIQLGIRRYGPMGWLRDAYWRHQFAHARQAHLFLGVYQSHEAAMAAAPPTAPLSYDNSASARLYLDRMEVDDYDYPALHWIGDGLRRGLRSLVDVGGSVGIKFYAFRRMLDYPAELRWLVVDMPAVVEEGRRLARERGGERMLSFSAELADAQGHEMLFASGALQYLAQSLPEILAGMTSRPTRIVINTTPIHERHAFFTLNSIGTAYCAYRVEARAAFIAAIEAQGYRLRDQWRNIGKRMPVIGQPEYSVDHYSGFCFDRCDWQG